MIARSIGIADNVAQLKGVKIDKYFWHDATQTTTFSGPGHAHATLARSSHLPGAISTAPNVIAQMKVHRLVILRGTYTKSRRRNSHALHAGDALHQEARTDIVSTVANDPWTGWQVEIDPATKTVVSPSNFPLANFKVNAYQAVTVN